MKIPHKLAGVDALRGYAILCVIAAHSVPPSLVWPVKRLFVLGFFGVQLFFIASAYTLLLSWARNEKSTVSKITGFFVNRVFRIAPLYFIAIVFYWFIGNSQPSDFSWSRLIATLFFYNAWSPYLTPTVGGWVPVPGGWSISVEFCFYAVFPLVAVLVTTLRRALWFAFASYLLMLCASYFGMNLYPEISEEQRANFLYYWFPNQLVIFSLGFVLYYYLKRDAANPPSVSKWLSADRATLFFLPVIFLLSLYGLKKFGVAPTHLLMGICFLIWATKIVVAKSGIVVNRAITSIGEVSFSMYILHFAILRLCLDFLDRAWPLSRDGIWSVPLTISIVIGTVCVTYMVALFTYKYIETPFVDLGKKLTRSLGAKPKLVPYEAA